MSIKASVQSAVFKAVTAAATLIQSEAPWWAGVPTKLLAKRTLVPAQHPNHLAVHTLTFQIPDYEEYKTRFATGQSVHHSQIRLELGDVVKMVIPDYKPKSYSVSRLDQTTFDVTLKVYPNGRASGFLDRLLIGDVVYTFGMQKPRQRNPGTHVNIVAYGVGITEAMPVAQAELEQKQDAAERVTLLWASRTMEDTFWSDELAALRKQHGERFQLIHIFSRDKVEGCLHGRINAEILENTFVKGNTSCGAESGDDDDKIKHRFLSVGTKDMMRQTDTLLAAIGYPQPEYSLLVE